MNNTIAKKTLQVEEALKELNNRIQSLQDGINGMRGRLEGVTSEEPIAPYNDTIPKVKLVPLANEIRLISEKCSAMEFQISDIVNRLEI